MPYIKNYYTGGRIYVSSAVRTSQRGSKRQISYCKRSAKIPGAWKNDPNSKNLNQRRRWKCPYLLDELTVSDYKL